ncbi:MAG: SRPBCC family protein [Flavobacteriales bacterium]|nr:SRPBCC family protein [Flavobacteriales bacterium]
MEPQARYGKLIAPDTIRFERTLPGPIERVWSYLTDSEKRGKWLASGPMELRAGGAAHLTWLHQDYAAGEVIPEQYKSMEKGHSMDAQVTRCEPPYVLAFTWGKRADALSEVVIELSERGNGVLLVLTHARLPNQKDLLGVSGGWHTHLDVLVELLNDRVSQGFWGKLIRLNEEYPQLLSEQ